MRTRAALVGMLGALIIERVASNVFFLHKHSEQIEQQG